MLFIDLGLILNLARFYCFSANLSYKHINIQWFEFSSISDFGKILKTTLYRKRYFFLF